MNRPELYHKVNYLQRRDAEDIIKRFATTMQWRYDGRDSLIDVGSGTGDVLMDFIHPIMPSNFQRLVCSDINPNTVKYAKAHYDHVNKSEFEVLDMASNNDFPQDVKEQFDHVTSFYAMMFVQNQRQGLRNVYQLLRREGGDCLLVFVAYHPTFDGYKLLSQMPKWSKYMKDVDDFIAALQYSRHPSKDYADYMTEVGFKNLNVEMQNKVFIYDCMEHFRVSMIAVNPWLDRIPPIMHDDFISNLMSTILKIMGLNHDNFIEKPEFSVPYKLVIAYARKPAIDISL